MQKLRPRPRAMTLIEIMMATALLLVVGLIIYTMLQQSARATHMGALLMEVQGVCRDLLDRVSTEMKAGVLLPATTPGTSPISSVVIWPDPYAAADNNSSTAGADRNRVIFSSMAGTPGQPGFKASDLSNYKFVEYRVMRDTQNRPVMARLVYGAYDPASSSGIRGLTYSSSRWVTNLNAFTQAAAENVQTLQELPYGNDNITLTISHPPKIDPLYGTTYDRNLFKIQITVEECLNGNLNYKRGFTLESQVTTGGL